MYIDDFKYEDAYKHFIDSKEVLEFLSLKLMFLGPPRLGKSTTRRRVMKEIIDLKSAEEEDQFYPSTGAIECLSDMWVKDTSDSNAAKVETGWTIVQSFSDEACLLFHCLKDSVERKNVPIAAANSSPEKEIEAEVNQASNTERSPQIKQKKRKPGLFHKMLTKMKSSVTTTRRSRLEDLTPHTISDLEKEKSLDYSEIATIYKEVSQQPNFAQEMSQSIKAYLRMQDTGGQPELMDMLPAFTIGPGLYLLFFSYEFKLDEEYQVFYQRASGEKTVPEKSEFTLKEMLLCTLASISCSTASRTAQPQEFVEDSDMSSLRESSKSVVYLVGTHKDMVSKEYVDMVDMKLQKIIEDTDFFRNGTIQFCSEDKLVVSLDNMGGGIEEIDQLHKLLERSMENHFKKLKIPASWLLFSLCLRMKNMRTASMETCLKLSGAFNMTPDETKTALWFLHHHAGLMMYFPYVAGLEDLIIIDVQVVYDSITRVILNAMIFDRVGQPSAERFKKTGQFSMSDITAATASISEDIIPPLKLVALLVYLHIIAQILSNDASAMTSFTEESTYIMPCVLESTSSTQLELFHTEICRSSFVCPLCVYFTCGFTPMGFFPAIISCLISHKSFTLIKEGIKKNMVQFLFGFNLHVTFISRSTYYEIAVSYQSNIQSTLHQECQSLKQEVENTLKKATARMNYNSYTDYHFGFECSSHEGEGHVGIVDRANSVPKNMMCRCNPNNPCLVELHHKHLIWFGQVGVVVVIVLAALTF